MLQRHNVSQELTGDAARFAGQGAGAGAEKSRPGSGPRQLSSRLLGRNDFHLIQSLGGSMSSDVQGHLNLVNASGFLFQIKVEQEINDTSSTHRKSVLAHEHRWVNSETGDEGFIDLIVSAGTNGKLIVECKRVREAEWVFLVPERERENQYARILWTRKLNGNRQVASWDEFVFEPSSLNSEFCIVRGHGENQRPMLERISTTLLHSVEAIAVEELTYERSIGRTGLRFYFPVIVTTASILACRYKSEEIDLVSGELQSGTFKEIPFIRFTKSLPSALGSSVIPGDISGAARESRRTIFVVNASHLVPFLSGRWEFRVPAWGDDWPWDNPRWSIDQ